MKTMPRANLAPPPAPARSPESSGAVPHVPVRAPFSRGTRVGPGLRITRRGAAVSVGVHLLLLLAIWLAPIRGRVPLGDSPVEGARGAGTEVSYVDIGAWPGSAGGAELPEAGGEAAGLASAPREAPADSASGAAPALQPTITRFPQRAPNGIPGAVPGARRSGGAPIGSPAGISADNTGAGAGGARGGTGARRNGPAGGRLGSELGDGRLIVPPTAATPRVLTDKERLNARVAERIRQMNDSTSEEAARQRRARNWTVRDRGGREWGIGEGGVPVVAGRRIDQVRLKPPIATDRDSELHDGEVARQRGEIDRQAGDEERDRNLSERTRATRERLERERAERARNGASGRP
jgi:hypothetical protein